MTTSRKASLPVGRLFLVGSVVAVFAFYAVLVGEMAVVGWDVLGRDNAYLFEVA